MAASATFKEAYMTLEMQSMPRWKRIPERWVKSLAFFEQAIRGYTLEQVKTTLAQKQADETATGRQK
jgi:hypothetical protein